MDVLDESRGELPRQETKRDIRKPSRLSDVDTKRRDRSGEPIGETNPALDRIKQAYDEIGEGNLQASLRSIAFDIAEDIKLNSIQRIKLVKK